jgi:hypothetical protein
MTRCMVNVSEVWITLVMFYGSVAKETAGDWFNLSVYEEESRIIERKKLHFEWLRETSHLI